MQRLIIDSYTIHGLFDFQVSGKSHSTQRVLRGAEVYLRINCEDMIFGIRIMIVIMNDLSIINKRTNILPSN